MLLISASVAYGQSTGEASVRLNGVSVIQVTASGTSPPRPAQPGSSAGCNAWQIVFTSRVTNNTAVPVRRTSVEVPVAYGTDLARAERALPSAPQGVAEVLGAPETSVRVRLRLLGTTDMVAIWSSSSAS